MYLRILTHFYVILWIPIRLPPSTPNLIAFVKSMIYRFWQFYGISMRSEVKVTGKKPNNK